LLFTLSITPKIFIHALVARHRDAHLSIAQEGRDQVNKTSFHCNVERLVVEVPCLLFPIAIQLQVLPVFPDHQAEAVHQYYAYGHFIFGLRGPPAVA
jgi:hypothetical protein